MNSGDLIQASDIMLTDDEAGTMANVTRVQDFRMELRHA